MADTLARISLGFVSPRLSGLASRRYLQRPSPTFAPKRAARYDPDAKNTIREKFV